MRKLEDKYLKKTQRNDDISNNMAEDNEKFKIKKLNSDTEEWEKIKQFIPPKEKIFHTEADRKSRKRQSKIYENDNRNIKNMLEKRHIDESIRGYNPSISPIENISKYITDHYRDDYQNQSTKVKLIQTQGNVSRNYSLQSTNTTQNNTKTTQLTSISHQIKSLQEAKYQLENTLNEAGYSDININFKYGCGTPAINFNAYESHEDKYQDKIKERLGTL